MNGKEILILVEVTSGVYAAVASQTNASISESNEVIDQSSKDARERSVAAGRYSATVNFDALYVPSNAAFLALKAAMRAGTAINLREQVSGTAVESASAIITDMTRNYPDQDNATISLTAAIDGAISAV